jgi:hypothetical protein
MFREIVMAGISRSAAEKAAAVALYQLISLRRGENRRFSRRTQKKVLHEDCTCKFLCDAARNI